MKKELVDVAKKNNRMELLEAGFNSLSNDWENID
jgi:hypothetical protein